MCHVVADVRTAVALLFGPLEYVVDVIFDCFMCPTGGKVAGNGGGSKRKFVFGLND